MAEALKDQILLIHSLGKQQKNRRMLVMCEAMHVGGKGCVGNMDLSLNFAVNLKSL